MASVLKVTPLGLLKSLLLSLPNLNPYKVKTMALNNPFILPVNQWSLLYHRLNCFMSLFSPVYSVPLINISLWELLHIFNIFCWICFNACQGSSSALLSFLNNLYTIPLTILKRETECCSWSWRINFANKQTFTWAEFILMVKDTNLPG